MGARQNNTPFSTATSRTGSYFTAGTSGSPCRSSDELQQSAFLMGNLDGAGRMGKPAPTTNCLHCQLAGASFFTVVAAVRGGRLEALFCQVEVIWSSAMRLEVPCGGRRSGSQAARGGISRHQGNGSRATKGRLRG